MQFHVQFNAPAARFSPASADENLTFILPLLTKFGVTPKQFVEALEKYISYDTQRGDIADIKSSLFKAANDPQLKPFQPLLRSSEVMHQIGNLVVINQNLGNGNKAQNKIAQLTLTDAANDSANSMQSNDCMLVAAAYENGQDPHSDVKNTFVIRSEDKAAGLGNAIKYYQKAADLGHTGAAAKVEYVTSLFHQHLATLQNLAVSVITTDNTDEDTQATHNHDTARVAQRSKASHEANASLIEAQTKKIAISAEQAAEKAKQRVTAVAVDAEKHAVRQQQGPTVTRAS